MNSTGQKQLLQIARKTIEAGLNHTKYEVVEIPVEFKNPAATFVTLSKNGQLRGCIGSLEAHESLIDNIQRNALLAAFSDYRFEPVTKEEIKDLRLEISILSKPVEIKFNDTNDLLDQIEINVNGLVLEADGQSATYLPQVWHDLPNKKDFLSSLCQKAGLEPSRWQQGNLIIKKYQVEKFSE